MTRFRPPAFVPFRRPGVGVAGMVLVAIAAAAALLPVPAPLVERAYSTGVYPVWQRAITPASNAVPFALFDLAIAVPVAGWIALAVRDIAARRVRALARILARTIVWCAVGYLLFLGAWGLNYRRVRLIDRLPFDRAQVSVSAARTLGRVVVNHLNGGYAAAHAAGGPQPGRIDAALAASFAAALLEIGAPARIVPARPKTTVFDWYFRRAGVEGMTDPFFLETLVPSDLTAFERPIVVAHEWAHLAGYADEGEANFVGWLTCLRGSASDRYAGWLFLFDEVAAGLPRADRTELTRALQEGPRADRAAIAARIARNINPRVAAAGWHVYDEYLKSNRVEAGVASYSEVVRLVLGTRFKPTS